MNSSLKPKKSKKWKKDQKKNGKSPDWPKIDTGHLEVLRPMIQASKYLGSWPRNGAQFILRLTPWNGLTLFILHFYTAHKFFNWMTVVKTTESVFEVFEQLTLIVRTAIVAICFDYRFFHFSSIMKLFTDIGTFETMNEEYNIRKLGLRVKVIVGISIFFVFLHLLFASIFMFHTSTSSYVNWLFYGESADKTPDYIVRSVMIADWALYLYLVICNECFFTTFFLVLCMIITVKIRDYDQMICRIHREKSVKNAVQVQELYQKHTRLTEIVTQANDSFSFPAFLWILCIIFNLAVKIESIIRGAKESDFDEFGYIFTDVLYYSLGFIGICTIAGNLSGVDSDAIVALTKIAEEGDIKDWVFQQEVQLLLTKLNTPMLKITGWSCFELDFKFMLTILGALATYTIIILQMA